MSVILLRDVLRIMKSIASSLEDQKDRTIQLEADYYWNIPTNDWTKLSSDPKPVVGSLEDDWQELKRSLEGDQVITSVDIDRFSSILRY